jgi:alkylation response protein AidB-like acyl-CoA dehydrogenase
MEMWRKFGEMGLLGITCSSEYGGLEMGYFMHVIAMEGQSSYLSSLKIFTSFRTLSGVSISGIVIRRSL